MIIKATRSPTVLVPVQVKEYSRRHFYTVESKTVGIDVSVIKCRIIATGSVSCWSSRLNKFQFCLAALSHNSFTSNSTGRRVFFFFRIVSNFKMVKTLTLLVNAGLFYAVSIIHRTLTLTTGSLTCVYMIFLHAYTHGGHRFIVSSEGLLQSLHRIRLRRNLRLGAKPSTWWSCTHPFGDHAWSCLTLASESECSCSVPLTLLCADDELMLNVLRCQLTY